MFKLFFATPDKKVVADAELEEITLPAFAGELNILPGHAPIMTTLEAGILSYKLKNGQSDRLAISWGYCQVSAEGVSVLAETAKHASEIDVALTQQQLKNAENKILNEMLDDSGWEIARREIARHQAEIGLAQQKKL